MMKSIQINKRLHRRLLKIKYEEELHNMSEVIEHLFHNLYL